ncbi:MAG: penicillin acylase family protein [Bacteroidota bacterium]
MRLGLFFLFVTFYSVCFSQLNPDNITIARDSFGVPHIFAPTDVEVSYGLAWAHCEDDFEHIQLILIATRARMGEITGKEGAATDYFVQFTKVRGVVERYYEKDLTANYKNDLQGYVDGLNAFAKAHPKEVKLKGIFPVSPKDIITGYQLILTSMVGVPKALEYIIKGKPDDYIFNASAGSNEIAIGSKMTYDSSTYLVINPHVPLEGQASWYEAHVCSEQGLNMYGALVPGMISPAMGCNNHLGWAITFNWPDYVDIYEMEINPENKNQYKFDGDWYDFEVRKIPLKVKTKFGNIKVKKEALWCLYGPAYRNSKGVYALRYNTMFNVKAAEQWFNLAKAKDFVTFYSAMQMQGIPLFNFMYADETDCISYIFNGSLPRRNPEYNWQKAVPGNTSKTYWDKFLTISELPQKDRPLCGYLYNTNNTPFRCTAENENPKEIQYNKQSAFNWNRINNRDLRFNELIEGKTKLTFQELKNIKYDCTYPKSGGIYKTFQPIYNLKEQDYPDIADAITKLKKWDLSGNVDNREAALAVLTFNYLFKKKDGGYNDLETGIEYDTPLLIDAIRYSKKQLLKYHKSIDVPFGDVQRLIRENKKLAVPGLPECLMAMVSEETADGSLRARNGDSFIMFAKFSKKGNSYESVVPFGESRRKDSPHLMDQMELYSKQQTKPVTLDKAKVLQTAKRIYHPK